MSALIIFCTLSQSQDQETSSSEPQSRTKERKDANITALYSTKLMLSLYFAIFKDKISHSS